MMMEAQVATMLEGAEIPREEWIDATVEAMLDAMQVEFDSPDEWNALRNVLFGALHLMQFRDTEAVAPR